MPIKTESDAYQITWLIRRLFRALGQNANKRLDDRGLTATERAVMEFIYPDLALTVPEIAQRYAVSRQHIQVTVNTLQEKGLISIRKNPKHKRSSLIALKKSGRDLFKKILKEDLQLIEDLFHPISATRQKQTRRTLEIVFNRLTGEEIS